jgi:hypothetical protein
VQVGWVDPHPSDIGDSAPPYERGIEFRRGFPEVLFVEPDILQSLPADYKIAGPRLQLIIEWKYRGAPNHGWIEEMWPSVSRALQSSQFSDWTFTNFNYELRWLHPLANNPAVARRVRGLVIDNDGHTDETALTGLFPLMPSLNTLVLGGQGWSLAVIHELGRAGLSKRLEHLGFDCLGTADTIEAIASAGAWPQLLSMTLHQLTGVEPTALSPLRAGMFPGLQYLQLWEGPGVRNTAEFVTALLECPSLANVKRIEYGHYGTIHERQPAIREIEQRSAGRFVYR